MTFPEAAVGLALAAFAFLVRVLVHWDRQPGGVDTWYHLAYARALRRHRRLDAPLPQYRLQDERQSYPPLFPIFLALLPERWLDRWFWVVSPALDCLQLTLVYVLTLRITQSLSVAILAAAVYAFTPQLISEVRSLNARSFGALVHALAVLSCLRFVLHGHSWRWFVVAVLAGAAVYVASATASVAYGLVTAVLAAAFGEPRFLLVNGLGFVVALVVSGGHLVRVFGNYLHAARYCSRNRGRFGAHPVRDSPVHGRPVATPPAERGFLGRSTFTQLLRLLGENPFLPALFLAAPLPSPWGLALYLWAMCLALLAVTATVVPFLRLLGPGRSFVKAGVLPIAYTLAVAIGSGRGLLRPVGLATLLGLLASLGAIAVFVRYVRLHPTQTVSVPKGLAAATSALADLPPGGVLCLPDVYADYAAYHSGRPVLWGGHCGDLHRFEWIAPVITRPIPDLMREHGIRYALLDERFARPDEIGLAALARPRGTWGSYTLFEVEFSAEP